MKKHADDASTGQLPLFGGFDFVPLGDGSYRAVPQTPVVLASITEAARLTGKSRDTIYRLFQSGLVDGVQVSPGKIEINMASLRAHYEKRRGPGTWSADCRRQYRGKAKEK